MNLTANFTLEELIASETARKNGWSNLPDATCVSNLYSLCSIVLQPLRDFVKVPVIVTSGYRSAQLNTAVGGVSDSYHLVGLAADIRGGDLEDTTLIYNYLYQYRNYDKAIVYYYRQSNMFIHVQYRTSEENRKRFLFHDQY